MLRSAMTLTAGGLAAPPPVPGGVRNSTLCAALAEQLSTPIARKASGLELAEDAPRAVERARRSGGQPLPEPLRAQLEAAFDGADFSGVRLHESPAVAQAAEAIQASAYTEGEHIYFGQGQMDLGSRAGHHLLLHELTHVIQHQQGRDKRPSPNDGLVVSQPTDPLELEAERVAQRLAPALQSTTAPQGGFGEIHPALMGGADALVEHIDGLLSEGGGTSGRSALEGGVELLQGEMPATVYEHVSERLGDGSGALMRTEEEDGKEEGGREPTPEELAALEQGEEEVEEGEDEKSAEDEEEVEVTTEEDEDQGTESEGGEEDQSVSEEDSTEDGEISTQGPTPTVAELTLEEPTVSDPVMAYLDGEEPNSCYDTSVADQLLESAWGLESSAADHLSPYLGEAPGGVLAQLGEGLMNFVGATERGDSGLATAIEVVDTLRGVAQTVGSLAGTASAVTGLLSLIGLFPPAAPIGAALLTASTFLGNVSTVASVVALVLSTITTVMSAYRLVDAVRDDAPEALDLYKSFRADVGNMVSSGIALGFNLLGRGNSKKFQEGLGSYFKAIKATDGRVARGILYQGLKSSNKFGLNKIGLGWTPRLLSTQGSTVASLKLKLGLVTVLRAKALFKPQKNTKKLVGINEQATANAVGFQPPPPITIGPLDLPQSTGGSSPNKAEPLPKAEHSPAEISSLQGLLAQLSAARGHVAEVKAEGNAAVAGGEELRMAAQAKEEEANVLDAQVAADKAGLETLACQAEEGKAQAEAGKTETQKGKDEGEGTTGEGKTQEAELAQKKVPDPESKGGLLSRLKAWFVEKVVGAIRKGLQWFQDLLSKVVLRLVSMFMGVDDIEGKLEAMGAEMDTAAEATSQAQSENEAVSQMAEALHQQAADANAAADAAISQGGAEVAEAEALDAQLAEEEARVAQAGEEGAAWCESFEDEHGEALEETGEDESDGGVEDCRTGAEQLSSRLDDQEQQVIDHVDAARDGLPPDLLEALDEQLTAWREQLSQRRDAVARVLADLNTLSDGPDSSEVIAQLSALLQSLAEGADADMMEVHEALGLTAERVEEGAQ